MFLETGRTKHSGFMDVLPQGWGERERGKEEMLLNELVFGDFGMG